VKQEGILQAGKSTELEGGVPLPTLQQQQEEEAKRQERILQTKKLQDAEEKAATAERLQQETKQKLEEMRAAAQQEEERQFQRFYSKGEVALQNGSYVDALESYQEALTHRHGDPRTQEKITLVLVKLKYGDAQRPKQAESRYQEAKQVGPKTSEAEKKTETIASEQVKAKMAEVGKKTE